VVTATDLLVHLEAKLEAALAGGDEALAGRMEEAAHFVREVAEAALVAGDEVTLREARRLAAKLERLGFSLVSAGAGLGLAGGSLPVMRTCPRCGQRFRGPAGPLDQVGALMCEDCARELLAGIRL